MSSTSTLTLASIAPSLDHGDTKDEISLQSALSQRPSIDASSSKTHVNRLGGRDTQQPLSSSNIMGSLDYEEREASPEDAIVSGLPNVDGGWGAWSYLAAATALETLVWGFANSYGVFMEHYISVFPHHESLLPIVGTVMTGSMYLLLPFFQLYLTAHPHWRPWTMWAGLGITVAGLIGAAFATSVEFLIFTQGILYGIGGTMLYCPTTAYMFEWWYRRRGFASGVMFSGTGAGGLIMPILCAFLLDKFGMRTTLISIAVGYAALLGALIPCIKPRLPLPSRTATMAPRIQWTFLAGKAFWLLWLGVLLQGLAAFMPSTYLPAYATALSLPTQVGTLSVALMNLARVPGQVLIGYISDKTSARKMITLMAAISTISVFAGWGAATDVGGVIAFAIVFGAFAGSYTALFPRFIQVIAHDDPHLPAILYALFSFARGVGSIASGPLSTTLLQHPMLSGIGGYGVGGYGALIVFTGAAMVGSGVSAGFKGLKLD